MNIDAEVLRRAHLYPELMQTLGACRRFIAPLGRDFSKDALVEVVDELLAKAKEGKHEHTRGLQHPCLQARHFGKGSSI